MPTAEQAAFVHSYRAFVNHGGPDREPSAEIVRQLRAIQTQSLTWGCDTVEELFDFRTQAAAQEIYRRNLLSQAAAESALAATAGLWRRTDTR